VGVDATTSNNSLWDTSINVRGGGENPANRSNRVPFSISLQMVGFRTNIGQFEHRVIHHLLLQSEVIAVFGCLLDRADRKTSELGWWRCPAGQVRIVGERDRVGECCRCASEIAERAENGWVCWKGIPEYPETCSRPWCCP